MSRILLTAFAVVLLCIAGADAYAGGKRGPDFSRYDWQEINPGARWSPRAGLQAIQLKKRIYVMGGRTPRPPSFPPIPGDSDIWGDVWASDDLGVSWQRILETDDSSHWPARAYFQAVKKGRRMYVIGGQNFKVEANDCPPSVPFCPPFVSKSDFFNDVWSSGDGVNWFQHTPDAGWAERAGLSAVVFRGEIYVMGGSFNDDPAVIGGPPQRIYFNDVWKSRYGFVWERVTEAAPWAPRAGAVAIVKGGYIYLIGGEDGFTCEPLPFCEPPYYNDVWRTKNGYDWEQVTAAAEWPARPGHQCGVLQNRIICFGGFGLLGNPKDMWASKDGAHWELISTSPWNALTEDEVKYDFDAIVIKGAGHGQKPAIFTFGGDRETFDFTDPLNYLRVDNDVWRYSPPSRKLRSPRR